VREWGDPYGSPLLFWHSLGQGANAESFGIAAEPLARAGYRVIAPDAPGFGRSAEVIADDYAVDRLARLLWEVADEVGVSRAVIGGHSWGGSVGVTAAAQEPDRTSALVLYDSGHADYADLPYGDLTATRDQLIDAAAENSEVASWDELVGLLRAEGLDQDWTLDFWRQGTIELPDGRVQLRAGPVVRGVALYEALHARPSTSWPAIGAARIPTLLILASEPEETREANERLLPRFLDAVPQAEVVRPGCRHQVFADLGSRAGDIVADWLREQDRA
jgi:pimeloyl-ACP methyl ester carboxylesterase